VGTLLPCSSRVIHVPCLAPSTIPPVGGTSEHAKQTPPTSTPPSSSAASGTGPQAVNDPSEGFGGRMQRDGTMVKCLGEALAGCVVQQRHDVLEAPRASPT
jgi:hypothetical protein